VKKCEPLAKLGLGSKGYKTRLQGGVRLPLGRLLAALIVCASLVPAAVQAAPVEYDVNGGSVTLTVVVNGVAIGSTVSSNLTGTMIVDQAAQSLDGLNIVLDSNIALALSTPYGGYDSILIESASITSSPGFTTSTVSSSALSFTVVGGALGVNGSYGGTDSLGVNAPVSGVPIAYPVPSITAIVTPNSSISLNGFTINSLAGASFGESSDLIVIANILVDPSGLTVIPEPSTALLLSMGMGLLAAGSRRRSD
jgi:hypothetical protein